jgi:hypothetical protein
MNRCCKHVTDSGTWPRISRLCPWSHMQKWIAKFRTKYMCPENKIYLNYTNACALLKEHNTTDVTSIALAGQVPESIIQTPPPSLQTNSTNWSKDRWTKRRMNMKYIESLALCSAPVSHIIIPAVKCEIDVGITGESIYCSHSVNRNALDS